MYHVKVLHILFLYCPQGTLKKPYKWWTIFWLESVGKHIELWVIKQVRDSVSQNNCSEKIIISFQLLVLYPTEETRMYPLICCRKTFRGKKTCPQSLCLLKREYRASRLQPLPGYSYVLTVGCPKEIHWQTPSRASLHVLLPENNIIQIVLFPSVTDIQQATLVCANIAIM